MTPICERHLLLTIVFCSEISRWKIYIHSYPIGIGIQSMDENRKENEVHNVPH